MFRNANRAARSLGFVTVLVLSGCGGSGSSGEQVDASGTASTAAVSTATQGSSGSTPSVTTTIVFESTPEASTFDPYANFIFAAESTESFECRLDSDMFVPCASPHLALPVAAGEHRFEIQALDAQGAVLGSAEHNWQVRSIFDSGATTASEAHPDLIATTVEPDKADPNSWRGIFRINCDFSHSSYDDPIVFLGESDAAHLHRFYGNMLLDENSTLETLFSSGDASCQGNTLNRSAYWIPALLAPSYDEISGQRELDENGEPAWQPVPAVVGGNEEAHEIFYYSAGIDDLDAIQPIPLGLKMIAGNHSAGPLNQQSTDVVRWHCQSWESSDGANPRWSTSIPACEAPDRVRMDIFFPSCWNGFDLDSFDHKSHLAYPVSSGGPDGSVCPDTHPVPILRVSFHYAFGVKPDVYEPSTQTSSGWRLASDSYDLATAGPGGMSLHGDWFNAWHPEALQAVLDICIKKGLDCHDGNLANGFRLSGTQAGSQEEPPVFNQGLGLHHH
ncbi:DUF1996 domain-containing protein [Congregibacter sp.]|uniref:DUF1996 domain-containing protein n=1 Tax=Congregibacter sp. TaxID=2744308 RepID=UPI00385CD093